MRLTILGLRLILAETSRRLSYTGPPLFAFCLAVGLVQCLPELPGSLLFGLLLAVACVFAALSWYCRRWPTRSMFAAIPLCFLLGLCFGVWRAELLLAESLPLEWERRDIVLEGSVAELTREFEPGGNQGRFVFRVERVLSTDVRVPERIMLSWYSGNGYAAGRSGRKTRKDSNAEGDAGEVSAADVGFDHLVPGDRWRLTVRLKRPHGYLNPGGFDYEAWMLERGIRATGYVRASPAAERLGASESARLGEKIEALRTALRKRLQEALPDARYAGVIVALAIGDQGSIGSDDWRIFAATGTTHLMSISGLHVTMLAALFGGVGGALWRRSGRLMLRVPAQRAAISVGWLAAFAYTLIAGAGVPALRTLLMLSVAALTHWLGRRVGVGRTLLLALTVVLIFDPWAVLAVGFWLSFAAVAVLLFFVAGDQEDDQRWRGWTLLRQLGLTQWVVTLGTLPILLWVFQQFSLVSPFANALAIPLVGFVVAPLSVASALLPIPFLATLAHSVLDLLMSFLVWLAGQPWALWHQAQPPFWSVMLAAIGIACHFLVRNLSWSLGWRLLPLILLLPALLPRFAKPVPGEAWVEFFDVGHGLSVLVRTAEHSLLFDGGPAYVRGDAGERLVMPSLRALGVQRLDGVVVSHKDNDHSGGVQSVSDALPVSRLMSSLDEGHPLRQGATPHTRCESGVTWEWDGVRFGFLSPPASYYLAKKPVSNRLSCVLRVEAAGSALLLTADMEKSEEAAILADRGQDAVVDVIQVSHHGSRSASGAAFVKALAPKVAVVSVGYLNSFGHPHPEVVARYREVGSDFYRTDRDGAVSLRLGQRVEVTTLRQTRPRYWYGK